VFGNRMPSIIFGPGKEEVMRGRRKLHSEKPHNSPSSPDIITSFKSGRMNWVGKCSTLGRDEECM
jgi:hypothetical protein